MLLQKLINVSDATEAQLSGKKEAEQVCFSYSSTEREYLITFDDSTFESLSLKCRCDFSEQLMTNLEIALCESVNCNNAYG